MIYIFIPAFNEQESIKSLINSTITTLKEANLNFKILVINDGSTDRTESILEDFKEDQHFELINHHTNKGLGETERNGFEYLAEISNNEDYIVRVEGDDTHSPEFILKIINKLDEGFDVVNTSRFAKGGSQIGLSFYRKLLSYGANIFMKILLRVKNVKDFSCGYRGYRAQVLKDAISIYGNNFLQLRGLGFSATLEILIKLKMIGCIFAEVPFELRYDKKLSKSKMVGSITMFGYFVLAVLYHWPFGGWRVQYQKIRKNFKKNRLEILSKNTQTGFEKFSQSKY